MHKSINILLINIRSYMPFTTTSYSIMEREFSVTDIVAEDSLSVYAGANGETLKAGNTIYDCIAISICKV